MNPELAKQAAVVLGWTIDENSGGQFWRDAIGVQRTPESNVWGIETKMAQLDVLTPEVARWCREKVENGFPGGRLEPCLVYGQMFTIDNRKTEWLWECSFTTAMPYLKLCAKSGKIILGRSDDPATAICLALVEADKKLKGETR